MNKSEKSVTVLIGDKDATVLNGLKLLIEMEDDFTVVGQASDYTELLKQACRFKPDLILMDFMNSYSKGLNTVKQVKKEVPDTKIIIMTTYPVAVKEVLHAGASNIFLKDCVPEELFTAMRI